MELTTKTKISNKIDLGGMFLTIIQPFLKRIQNKLRYTHVYLESFQFSLRKIFLLSRLAQPDNKCEFYH